MDLIVFARAQEKVLRGRVPFCFMWGDLDWLLTGVLTMVVPHVTQKQERHLIGTNDPVLALSSDLFDTLHLTPSAGVTRGNVKLVMFFLSYTSNMIRQHRNTLQCGKVLKLPRMRGNSDAEWGATVTLAGLIAANLQVTPMVGHLYQNKYHCLINQTSKPNWGILWRDKQTEDGTGICSQSLLFCSCSACLWEFSVCSLWFCCTSSIMYLDHVDELSFTRALLQAVSLHLSKHEHVCCQTV